jgi:hypothetical protein
MKGWIEQVLGENKVLRENGADIAAAARCRVLVQFVEAAREWLDAEVDVAEAAEAAGRCEETIRRAVRSGTLADRRPGGRGRHRVRRGDLAKIRAYDPAADAVRLATRRGQR